MPMQQDTPRAQFKRPSAAVKALGVSSSTLRRWAEQGRIRHVRLDTGEYRYDVDEYMRWNQPKARTRTGRPR